MSFHFVKNSSGFADIGLQGKKNMEEKEEVTGGELQEVVRSEVELEAEKESKKECDKMTGKAKQRQKRLRNEPQSVDGEEREFRFYSKKGHIARVCRKRSDKGALYGTPRPNAFRTNHVV